MICLVTSLDGPEFLIKSFTSLSTNLQGVFSVMLSVTELLLGSFVSVLAALLM